MIIGHFMKIQRHFLELCLLFYVNPDTNHMQYILVYLIKFHTCEHNLQVMYITSE